MESAQELFTVGYSIVTVDGPRARILDGWNDSAGMDYTGDFAVASCDDKPGRRWPKGCLASHH